MEAIDGADVREDAVDNIGREGTAVPGFFQQPGTEHLWSRAKGSAQLSLGFGEGRGGSQVRAVSVGSTVDL